MYFGENDHSNVLKSLNIEHVITYNTVFSICNQYVEFYKVFPRKVSDKPNGTFVTKYMQKVLIIIKIIV